LIISSSVTQRTVEETAIYELLGEVEETSSTHRILAGKPFGNPLESPTTKYDQAKDFQQMLKGVVSSFLLCLLNYPDMFRLPNAIFRGLHFPFLYATSVLVYKAE
jgi:hypothetical protein